MSDQTTHEKYDEISLRLHMQLVQAITDTADRLGIPETDEEYPASVLAKIEARARTAEAEVERLQAQLAEALLRVEPVLYPRPSTDELLGIAPDWTGGQDVDEYIDDIRRD